MRKIFVMGAVLCVLLASGLARAAEELMPPPEGPGKLAAPNQPADPHQPAKPDVPESPAQGVPAASEAPQTPQAPAPAEPAAPIAEEGAIAEPLPPLVWYDGTVTRVRDTDLIEIDGEKMRLLGVTGPRRFWWGAPRDCHAPESIGYLEEALKDKEVRYAFDPAVGPDNRRGIRRVYVMEGERLVNADLIEKGMGFADRARRYAMQPKFMELEDAAKLHMLGLWHTCPVECYRTPKVCRVMNW